MILDVLNHGNLAILTAQVFMWFFGFQILIIILLTFILTYLRLYQTERAQSGVITTAKLFCASLRDKMEIPCYRN